MSIPKWSVNDGICDCCDGSDEWNNKRVNCSNTCANEKEKYTRLYNYIKKHFENGFIMNNNASVNVEIEISKYNWLLDHINSTDKVMTHNNSIFYNLQFKNNIELYHFDSISSQSILQSFQQNYIYKLYQIINSVKDNEKKTNTYLFKKVQNTKTKEQERIQNGKQVLIYHDKVLNQNQNYGKFKMLNGRVAEYINGEYCWIAHSGRQTFIEEVCWDSNILLTIVEYDNCRHKGVLLTPNACDLQYIELLDRMDGYELIEFANKIGIDPDNIPRK